MIRQTLAVAIRELQLLAQDWSALALLFLMPAFFIVVMSFALQNVFEAGSASHPILLLVVDEDGGPVSRRVVDVLARAPGIELMTQHDGMPWDRAGAERAVRERRFPAALILPVGLSRGAAGNENDAASASLIVDPATQSLVVAPVRGAVESALRVAFLFDRLPRDLRRMMERYGAERDEGPPPDQVLDELEAAYAERLAEIDPSAGTLLRTRHPADLALLRRPSATEQSVPAYTIFGVFFITLTLATSFVRERVDGTLRRLQATPLSRGALLLGKLVPYALVNLVQIALMFGVGAWLFGLALGDATALVAISLCVAATATGLGLLVAAFGRTEAQVGALAVACSITLAALGGLMVPSYVMPGPMRTLSLATPHAWALRGYHEVMLRGGGLASVADELAVLIGFALVFYFIALLRFRFR